MVKVCSVCYIPAQIPYLRSLFPETWVKMLLACQIADFQINYISRKNGEVASFFVF